MKMLKWGNLHARAFSKFLNVFQVSISEASVEIYGYIGFHSDMSNKGWNVDVDDGEELFPPQQKISLLSIVSHVASLMQDKASY